MDKIQIDNDAEFRITAAELEALQNYARVKDSLSLMELTKAVAMRPVEALAAKGEEAPTPKGEEEIG